ncbi:MAG: hypothetical protein LUG18_01700 [Candidatus Azobacteroides sp.]|nr:hypothetical protein [Candidatus Azobacteroides sp.]
MKAETNERFITSGIKPIPGTLPKGDTALGKRNRTNRMYGHNTGKRDKELIATTNVIYVEDGLYVEDIIRQLDNGTPENPHILILYPSGKVSHRTTAAASIPWKSHVYILPVCRTVRDDQEFYFHVFDFNPENEPDKEITGLPEIFDTLVLGKPGIGCANINNCCFRNYRGQELIIQEAVCPDGFEINECLISKVNIGQSIFNQTRNQALHGNSSCTILVDGAKITGGKISGWETISGWESSSFTGSDELCLRDVHLSASDAIKLRGIERSDLRTIRAKIVDCTMEARNIQLEWLDIQQSFPLFSYLHVEIIEIFWNKIYCPVCFMDKSVVQILVMNSEAIDMTPSQILFDGHIPSKEELLEKNEIVSKKLSSYTDGTNFTEPSFVESSH